MTTGKPMRDVPLCGESTPHKLTRESLVKYRKLDLQNQCREMGISKVWVRKDELIDMILETSKSTPAPNVVQTTPHPPTADQQPPSLRTATHIQPLPAASQQSPPSSGTATPTPGSETTHLQTTPTACSQLPYNDVTSQPIDDLDAIHQPSLNGADHLPHSLDTSQSPSQTDINHSDSLPPDNHDDTQHQPEVDVSLHPSTPDGLVLDLTQGQTPTALGVQQPALSSQVVPRLDDPPPGTSGTTTHRVSETDKETHNETEKIKKCIEKIMSKLETKDLEMELLTTEIKSAYSTIEMLQKRVSELESKNKDEKISAGSPFTTNSLLLGDTNVQQVLPSDLAKNCSVRTITMGNIDKIRNFVTHKLSSIPSTCVLYCGLYDLCDNVDSDAVLDNLGSLVSDLKYKCSNMKIYVCDIVPAQGSQEANDKIIQYNEKLLKWADANGVFVVNTSAIFTLSTGDVDEMCFNTASDTTIPIFNRFGVIRLLDAIDKQCPDFQLCSKWSENKRIPSFIVQTKQANKSKAHQHTSSHHKVPLSADQRNVNASPFQVKTPNPYPPLTTSQVGTLFPPVGREYVHVHQTQPAPTAPPPKTSFYSQFPPPPASHPSPETYVSVASTPPVMPHKGLGGPPPPHREAQHSSHSSNVTRPRLSHHNRFVYNSRERHTAPHNVHYSRHARNVGNYLNSFHDGLQNNKTYKKKMGCYNCGEFNHIQANCRFDHKLQCQQCHSLGHKSKLCSYYC